MIRKIAAILILWLPFSLAALVSIPVLFYGILAEDKSIWRPVGRSMDKLLASLLGFSGENTLSAELGVGSRLQLLRKVLDTLVKDHCASAARSEGLIK